MQYTFVSFSPKKGKVNIEFFHTLQVAGYTGTYLSIKVPNFVCKACMPNHCIYTQKYPTDVHTIAHASEYLGTKLPILAHSNVPLCGQRWDFVVHQVYAQKWVLASEHLVRSLLVCLAISVRMAFQTYIDCCIPTESQCDYFVKAWLLGHIESIIMRLTETARLSSKI